MYTDTKTSSVIVIYMYACTPVMFPLQGLCKTYYAGIKRKNEVIPNRCIIVITVCTMIIVSNDYIIVYLN